MRAQGGGRIVLMSSIGGVIGIPFQAFYSASKFAMEGLGEALAYEVAPFGVHVTLVEPGNVKTDFTASRRRAQAAGGDVDVESSAAQGVEVGDRRLRAGQDHQIGIPRQRTSISHADQLDFWFSFQRVEVVVTPSASTR